MKRPIQGVKRIRLAAYFRDQLERLPSDFLKAEHLEGLMIEAVDAILFAPVIGDFG